ncbi:MAG: two-component system sensor histidine kinase and response regulator WspE [Alteromonadaceae bacterium]
MKAAQGEKQMDIDFNAIFKDEVAGQIKRITALALLLENREPEQGKEDSVLQDLMREFHTIKGAARAINNEEIKNIAHVIEDIYQAILNDKAKVILPDLVNISLHAIDLIKGLLHGQFSGEASYGDLQLNKQASDYLAGKTLSLSVATNEADSTTESGSTTESDSTTESTSQITKTSVERSKPESSTPKLETKNTTLISPSTANPSKTDSNKLTRNSTEYELLTDSLMALSGELAIAVDSFSSKRPEQTRLFSQITKLQREMTLLFSTMLEPLNKAGLSDYAVRLELFNRSIHQLDKHKKSVHDYFEHADDRLQFLSNDLDQQIHHARMMPLSVLFDGYPRMVRDLAIELNKDVKLHYSGENARLDRGILDVIRNPMIHILRNAIDHGIESASQRLQLGKSAKGNIHVDAKSLGSQIVITIIDDGRGIDLEQIKRTVVARGDTNEEVWEVLSEHEKLQFLFLPGFTTSTQITETSGRGFGMDIIKSDIDSVGGRVELAIKKNLGMSISLYLPLNLSLTRCLMVNAGKHHFFADQYVAFPLNEIESIHRVMASDIKTLEGNSIITLDGEIINLHQLADLMNLSSVHKTFDNRLLLLLGNNQHRCALIVDEVVDERDIVMRSFDERIGKITNFQAMSMMIDGSAALVADVQDIIRSASDITMTRKIKNNIDMDQPGDNVELINKLHILVVEDSATVREVERHMLEQAGYQVSTAVDGMDGLNKCRNGTFNLIISDIDMPRMNGIEMIKQLREKGKYTNTPIIVVSYKDRDDDRLKALTAGADHYVTKAAFDSGEMLAYITDMTSQ